MEKELVKKYYVEFSTYPSRLGFALLWGTVGKIKFMVKEQQEIVGSVWDKSIDVNSPYLFDNLDEARSKFGAVSNNLVNRKLGEIENIKSYVENLGNFHE